MKQTIRQLEHWVSTNQFERAIRSLRDALTDFRADVPTASEEVKDLRMEIIGLSSRYHDLKDRERNGRDDPKVLQVERRAVTNALLTHIGELPQYREFAAYLDNREEEQAWVRATEQNSISAYQEYFNQYPEGKYVSETAELIEQLKKIQADQARRMKDAAAQERRRRDQQPTDRQQPRPNPLHAGVGNGGSHAAQGIFGKQQPAQKSLDNTLAILLYIASAIIPIVGLGYGGYLYFSKEDNGQHRYDDAARKKSQIMMGLGAIFFLIYLGGGM